MDNQSASNSEGILAGIFREIRKKIPAMFFAQCIDVYINKRGKYNASIKERASARGNIKKELEKDEMSWKVFIKALEIIGARKIEMTFKITGGNGHVDEYTKTVHIAPMSPIVRDNTEEKDNAL
jgi:ribosome maturation protein Sdo1